ncbi:MAG: indolepyruvate ferredoxin oxidoreductase subunit alpha [Clostridiales bacterium]|nr:indolepyruvate ferredoxin oxidoreductase subunit alpha [Clostridiales bacterium]
MKELMLGNKAVARGLYEAGCSVISSYPGTPSTEITEEAAKYPEIYCEWAPNEKVALEVAHGAAVGGVRAACCMKHVGLNVAADPLFTISYQGVEAGLVICVADDPGMFSSQNEQDSRHYAIAAKVPMLEPSDSQEALEFTKEAFCLSEEYHTPVLVRMCTRISHSQSIVAQGNRQEVPRKPYVKDTQRVMMTTNSLKAHYRVEERTRAMTELAETTWLNRMELGEDTSLGIITSSTSYQYVREVFGDKACVLKLGLSWPMPVKKIQDFAAKVDRVLVVEELEPIIENHCRQIGVAVTGKEKIPMVDELTQGVIARSLGRSEKPVLTLEDPIPGRPPVMCAGCPHRGVFYTLAKNKCMVYGDIGCYTLGVMPPLNAMDLNVCMGASCSGLHGFNLAGGAEHEKHSVAVIGDSTFAHSGITGIADIAYNRSNSTVIILDNSITGMTGHQQNPTTGKTLRGEPAGKIDLEALCRAIGFERVRVVDPNQLKEMDKVLKEELAAEEPSVIITRSPCVMLKEVPKAPPLKVDEDKCNGCSLCMRIGCPALSLRGEKVEIDKTQCIGCQVCMQMCHRDALIVG